MEYYGYVFIFVLMGALSALVYFSFPCNTPQQPSGPSGDVQAPAQPAPPETNTKPPEQLKEPSQESQKSVPEPVGLIQTSDLYEWDRRDAAE